MKVVYTVYEVRNTLNGNIYVGVHKTTNPHDSYMGSGIAIKNAIKSLGKRNFSKRILANFDSSVEAYQYERTIVTPEFVARTDTYNLVIGGVISIDFPKSECLNRSERISGEKHHFFGKTLTSEHRRRISEGNQGRQKSDETIAKYVQTRTGKPNTKKRAPLSEEDKLKKSLAAKRRKKLECPHCKKVIDPGNAKIWHFDNCKLFLFQ